MKRIIAILVLILFSLSCNKDTIMYPNAVSGWKVVWTGDGLTTHLNSITFTDNNTGYASGGSPYWPGQRGKIIVKTTDSGNTWLNILNDTLSSAILSIDFVNSNTGFAVGVYRQSNALGMILKTTNAGISWNIYTNPNMTYLSSVNFPNENTGYACGIYNIIMKTTDCGASWVKLETNFAGYSIYFVNSSIGFSTSTYDVYKTENGGLNWMAIHFDSTYLRQVYFSDINTGYLIGNSPTETAHIIKTTNNGTQWNYIPFNIPGLNDISNIFITSQNKLTGYAYCLADCNSQGCKEKIIMTTNGGNTWKVIVNDLNMLVQWGIYYGSIYFTDLNTGFVCGYNILKTTSGGQ